MLDISSRVRGARLAFTPAVLGALLALSAACAPAAQRSMSLELAASNALELRGRSLRHTIARSELHTVPAAANAYDLITRLRPEFLRGNYRRVALGSEAEPVVYVDALKAGNVSALHLIPIAQVLDVTYVAPVDAMVRFGPTHGAGAIIVRTRQ